MSCSCYHNGCLASSPAPPTPSCLVRAAVNAATDELKCVFGVTDAFVKGKKKRLKNEAAETVEVCDGWPFLSVLCN